MFKAVNLGLRADVQGLKRSRSKRVRLNIAPHNAISKSAKTETLPKRATMQTLPPRLPAQAQRAADLNYANR